MSLNWLEEVIKHRVLDLISKTNHSINYGSHLQQNARQETAQLILKLHLKMSPLGVIFGKYIQAKSPLYYVT